MDLQNSESAERHNTLEDLQAQTARLTLAERLAMAPEIVPVLLDMLSETTPSSTWDERNPHLGGWPYIPVEPEVRAPLTHLIFELLGQWGRASDIPALLQVHLGTHNPSLLVYAIVRMGGTQAISFLLDALATSEPSHSLLLLQCLELLPEPETLPALQASLQHTDPAVRSAALKALEAHGSHAKPLLSEISQALHDRAVRVREQAARTLGALGDRQVVPSLLQSLQDREPSVRVCAIEALRCVPGVHNEISADTVLPALLDNLSHPSQRVQKAVLEALAEFGPRAVSALPSLLALLTGSDVTLAQQAARTLGAIGTPEVIAPLLSVLRIIYYDSTLRATVAEVLGQCHIAEREVQEEVCAALFQTIQKPNVLVQCAAAAALGQRQTLRILPVVEPWLLQEHAWLQRQAAQIIEQLGSVDAIPALCQSLSRAGEIALPAIITALAKLATRLEHPKDIITALWPYLQAADEELQQHTLFALLPLFPSLDHVLLHPILATMAQLTDQLITLFYWPQQVEQLVPLLHKLLDRLSECKHQAMVQDQLQHTLEHIEYIQHKAPSSTQAHLQKLQQHILLLQDDIRDMQHWREQWEEGLFAE